MSPEQARGVEVDKRTDIWSFGCVLFEMLAARQAFHGELTSDVMASVLRSNPDYRSLPPAITPTLKAILRRSMEKNPKDRYRDIGDVRYELRHVDSGPGEESGETAVQDVAAVALSRLPWVVLGVVVGAILAGAGFWNRTPTDPELVTRFEYDPPADQIFQLSGRTLVSYSADGRGFVFSTRDGLYLRSMEELEARPVPGSGTDLSNPVFSPDGEWVAYFSLGDNQLKKIATTGGAPVPLTDATDPFGVDWGAGDTILYGQPDGIWRVSANGGTADLVVPAVAGEQVDAPQFLPGDEWILFTTTRETGENRWNEADIVARSLQSEERRVLVEGGSHGRFVPTGHLVYAVGDVLFAIAFDVDSLKVTGGTVPVVEDVLRSGNPAGQTGTAQFSISNRGSLIYVSGGVRGGDTVLAFIDPNGTTEVRDVPVQRYYGPRVSPDRTQLVAEVVTGDDSSIVVAQISENTNTRRLSQTSEGNNRFPMWTPDGDRVTFTSDRDGPLGIYWQSAEGTDVAERLFQADEETGFLFPNEWSPDGRTLAFSMGVSQADASIWMLSLDDGDGTEPEPVYDAPDSGQWNATFSPDWNWFAYSSNEASIVDIFVQPFPPTGRTYRVTETVSLAYAEPQWSPDGTELFYATFEPNRILAIDVTTNGTFVNGVERSLPIEGWFNIAPYRDFDVTSDGQRFLVAISPDQAATGEPVQSKINVVVNWFQELKERVPVP